MNLKFLLGFAAGVGIAYYFTSEKGQQLIQELNDTSSNLKEKGEETLEKIKEITGVTKPERFVKDMF